MPPAAADISSGTAAAASLYDAHPTSSSVPAYTILGSCRATSAGPRLHDYSIPAVARGSGGLTELRPGLLGVPTGSGQDVPTTSRTRQSPEDIVDPRDSEVRKGSLPVPVPVFNTAAQYRVSGESELWDVSSHYEPASDHSPTVSHSFSGGGGWSLPRSSLRSASGSSRSRSGSGNGSRSDDESEIVDADVELAFDDEADRQGHTFSSRGRLKGGPFAWKREEEEFSLGFSVREEDEDVDEDERMAAEAWDGMDMDMDMD